MNTIINKANILLFFCLTSLTAQVIKSEKTNIYRRSSISTFMLNNVRFSLEINSENTELIKEIFLNAPLPEKFDDHNISYKIIPGEASSSRRSKNALRQRDLELTDIQNYFETNQIAKKLVEKWFNRDKNGAFNMSLIEERGFYDATTLKIDFNNKNVRGLSILGDAGEELINNTFVIVNSYEYWDLGPSFLDFNGQQIYKKGKGYQVFVKTYLFQLDWNKEVENTFYEQYWCDNKTSTPSKIKLFDDSNLFKLKYLGFDFKIVKTKTPYTSKSEFETCIRRATINTMDDVIVLLQRKFDAFKTKATLNSIEPITAKVGLKEGITTKSVFEVLEQEILKDGKTKFNVIGTIGVDNQYPIWDNQYGANEDNPQIIINSTHFTKLSGGEFQPGMLIVERKEK
jgi:hypothetical protein